MYMEGLEGVPSADFSSGASSDEELELPGGGENGAIFSRADHIKSLGLYKEEEMGLELDPQNQLEPEQSQKLQAGRTMENRTVEMEDSNVSLEHCSKSETAFQSWDDFKTDFDDVFREAEEKIASGDAVSLPSPPLAPALGADIRNDLIIEMITSLHDSRQKSADDAGAESVTKQIPLPLDGAVSHVHTQNSPSRPRKQLLSLSNLETIHESDIDRLLESVPNVPNRPSAGTDSDFYSLTDSDTASPSCVHSRKAWGMQEGSTSDSGSEGLMKQLHQLSLDQAGPTGSLNGSALVSQAESSGCQNGTAISSSALRHYDVAPNLGKENTVPSSERKKEPVPQTVVIDLRSGGATSVSSAHEQRCESDESEDEDDPYTWAQKRKAIKSEMIAFTHCSPSFPSSIPSSSIPLHQSPAPLSTSPHTPSHLIPPPHQTAPTSHTYSRHHNLHGVFHSTRTEGTVEKATAIHKRNLAFRERNVATTGQPAEHNVAVTEQNVAAIEQDVADVKHNVAAMECTVAVTEHHADQNTTSMPVSSHNIPETSKRESVRGSRQRSSDSLTLSSSVSDSEVTSSEGASCSGEQTKNAAKGAGKKSKKQAKKSKKGQKKSQPSKERSEKSLRRRAHVIQRIRNDSWNTSSDEENSLTPLTESSSTETALTEERGEAIDVKVVKADLQKRILSKKPPAQFETPATEPIYHEDVSFGHGMVALHHNSSSSDLLTLPLTRHGLATLPPPWSEMDVDTLVVLHCLVLTWLACQAAIDYSEHYTCQGAESFIPHEEGGDPDREVYAPPTLSKLPFRITGFQQTVLDGQLSLLIAIQRKGNVAKSWERTRDSNFPCNRELVCEEIEGLLSTVTLQAVLQPFLSLSSFTDDISLSVLSSLSHGGALVLPLTSLFRCLDHITPFATPVSFYWSSIYHLSALPSDESLKSANAINTTVCTLNYTSLGNPHLVYTVLSRVFSSGLDLAGIRLLFGEQSWSPLFTESTNPQACGGGVHPILTLALRGPNAVNRWMDVLGPDDSELAKVTDPTSVSAVFGSGLVHAVRNSYQSTSVLAKWFGGRACLKTGAIYGMSDARTKSERRKRQRVRFSESESEDGIVSSPLLPDSMFPPIISNLPRLIAQAYSKSLLVVSPNVPPSCYSSVLASCSELGFDIFGAKRIRLNGKRASSLEISVEFVSHFTPSSTPPSPLILDSNQPLPLFGGVVTSLQAPPPLPSLIIIIGRENAALHSTILKMLIMRNIQLLVKKNKHIKMDLLDSPNAIVHLIPYSEDKLKFLGSFTTPVPPGSNDVRVDCEDSVLQEEICFIAVPGVKSLPTCVNFLDKLFCVTQPSAGSANALDVAGGGGEKDRSSSHVEAASDSHNDDGCRGFELVGLRIVPQLSRFHAKKLCPIVVGDSLYSQAVQLLSDRPATLLVLRGMCCNKKVLGRVLPAQGVGHAVDLEKMLQHIISHDLPEAVRFTSLFFSGKDLFSDSSSQILTPYLPEAWIHQSDILQSFLHPRDSLFSVLWFALPHLKLAVKVLNKLSRSGFVFAGISTVMMNMDGSDTTEGQDSCAVSAYIAVCVEKTNAVWLLQHLVQPFIAGEREGAKKIKYSESFSSAISDLRRLFPDGVYTQGKGTVLREYNIKILCENNFSNLALSKECLEELRRTASSSLLIYVSPFLERTAIILPSSYFTERGDQQNVDGFVYVLDFLCQSRFDVYGMKMVLFSKDSAQELQAVLSYEIELDVLVGLPCLVVILERDNAASCFQLIVKSALQAFHGHTDIIDKLLSKIIAPSDAKQANRLLSFFDTS